MSTKRIRQATLALFCSVATLVPAVRATAQTCVGMNDHIIWRTNADQDVAFAKYADSNTKYLRVGADWNALQPTAPTVNVPSSSVNAYNPTYLGRVDYFFQKCTAAGIRVLLCPAYAPSWASVNNPKNLGGYAPSPTTAATTAYADYCEFLLRHYTAPAFVNSAGQHTLEGIEIWNEPDYTSQFFIPYGNYAAGATAYGNLVVAAGGRIKSVRSTIGASDVMVLAPVVSQIHNVCWAPTGQPTWMDTFYSVANVTANYDIFDWHSYWESSGTGWLPATLPPCWIADPNTRIQSVLGKLTAPNTGEMWEKMVSNGDDLKPNWCTEIGGAAKSATPDHPNRFLSLAEQQTHLTDAIATLRSGNVSHLDRIYWYEMFDEPNQYKNLQQAWFGLMALNATNPITYTGGMNLSDAATTLTPKPAYAVYQGADKGEPEPHTHTGTWAAQAVLSGTPTWDNLYQIPAVAPNSNYTFSFWMKGSGQMRLKIQTANWSSLLLYRDFTATSTWTQYTLPMMNTGTNTGLVYCFQDDGTVPGTVYLDDCFMGQVSGANQLSNSGFESGASSWHFNGPFSILQNP